MFPNSPFLDACEAFGQNDIPASHTFLINHRHLLVGSAAQQVSRKPFTGVLSPRTRPRLQVCPSSKLLLAANTWQP